MTLTAALLDPALTRAPARPLITFYDDATGERVELSALTMANWAAKTANLLRDDCDVETGTRIAVLLPAHWQTAAVLLGAWWCGAHVVAEPAEAEWVLCDGDRVDLALAAQPSAGVVALSLNALGHGLPGLPAGVLDYATEVRLHGDEFSPWEPVDDAAPALGDLSVSEVLAAARGRGAELGFTASDRVLSMAEWSTAEGLVEGLLAVLAAGASLVQCRHADLGKLVGRAAAERCTRRL